MALSALELPAPGHSVSVDFPGKGANGFCPDDGVIFVMTVYNVIEVEESTDVESTDVVSRRASKVKDSFSLIDEILL